MAQAISQRKGVMLLDQSHLAAQVGLAAWHGGEHWYGYKLATSPTGTIATAHAASRMIAGALGKASKCLVLDLDNTLWGGVIGDDGLGGIKLGRDSAIGEAYLDFQAYCLQLKARGVLLAVASKNDPERAREGFQHPDSLLKLEDFSAFVASWDPKDRSLRSIAQQLNIGLDSLVFVDDNPAERALVREQLPQVKVPEIGSSVTEFASIVEHNLYFERPELSAEDLARAYYYAGNRQREEAQGAYANYDEYLASLGMRAELGSFSKAYLERIAQLINKTNQFNLTTRRYTLPEVTRLAESADHVTLWGRLIDRFGDNGLVSVLLGECRNSELHIDLWLMSCRVLKRAFEQTMLDALVDRARQRGLRRLVGYYKRSPKNEMVAEHYGQLGFSLQSRDPTGSESVWTLELEADYVPRNTVIEEIVVHE
jgi:FkbH-like protein